MVIGLLRNLTCATCGEPITGEDPGAQPYPPNGDWVHVGECQRRYWDPPGEAFLTEESW